MSRNLGGSVVVVRRLAAKGWPADSIARLYHLTRSEVLGILHGPSSKRPAAPRKPPRDNRPIEPERLSPRHGKPLKRPRSRREQEALSEWPRCEPPAAELVTIAAPIAAELPRVDRSVIDLVETNTASAEDWGSMHASSSSGGSQGNAALTDADACRIRRRRAEGVSRADLAREYGVSLATVTRITRRDTYRQAELVELAAPAELTVVADDPAPRDDQGERWEAFPGDR